MRAGIKTRRTGLLLAGTLAAAGSAWGQAEPKVAPAVVAAAAPAGTIRGTVMAGKVPLPGVAVTATNTLTGKKYATTTDVDGNFAMAIPKSGRYVVKAELAAFAVATNEVRITAEAANQTAAFSLELASRAAATQASAGAAATAIASALGRGTQTLTATGDSSLEAAGTGEGNTGVQQPTLGGFGGADGSAAATESVAVSGQQGTTNALGGLNEDQIRERVEDAVNTARANGVGGDQINAAVAALGGILQGGNFGGPGSGGFRGGGRGNGGGGGGNFRNFNPAQPHGAVFYTTSNSALNSAPWSPTLIAQHNPSAYSNRFGVSLAGSPYVPGLFKPDTRQFVFINLTGQKNLNAFLPNPVRVPTALERTGDFSQSFQRVNGGLTPVMLYDPNTGQPIAGNNIANSTVPRSTQAAAILAAANFYPLCNENCTSTDPTVYNYQTISNAGSNNIAINSRYTRSLGPAGSTPFGRGGGGGGGQRGQNRNAPAVLRQSINASYNYSHAASDQRNIFLPLGGATESDGNALNLGYTVGYGRLSNNASVNWNRSFAQTRNYFTNTTNNPSAAFGINIPTQNAGFANPEFYNGLPAISITNFAGLSNTTPNETINQTIAFTDFVAYRHKKHNYRFGVDIRRVHADSLGGSNPLGQFSFTGYATESPTDQIAASGTAASGSGFADFLLGLPTSTKIQAGLNKIYLRENQYDLYAQDDFRVLSNVTLNYGLRYEYFGPYSEKNGRLANLDHNANFTSVAVVMPGQAGPYQGKFNNGLVNPDNTLFAPRFGAAYSPRFKYTKNTVLRGGYGVNYNTGQFASFARSLSFQPPFAQVQTNAISTTTASTTTNTGCTTTLAAATYVNAASQTVVRPAATANVTLGNGFGATPTATGCSSLEPIHNSFAVDKNYRLGLVQVYNLNVQRTIGASVVVNVGYNGSKGSNLDVVGSPNSTPVGNLLAGQAAPFTFEESVAGSHSNQLLVSVQQRQRKGVALGLTYTYSHSIDNASSIGGTSATTVQNFNALALEESNSSFDQRHLLAGNYVLELPFGPNRAFLNKGGIASRLLDGFSLSGNVNIGSGLYFTPQYAGSVAEASSGNDYTQRPNRVFAQPIKGSGKLGSFFNAAAFAPPTVVNGVTQFGTASRNSIEGPGQLSTNTSLSRTVPLGDTRSFEARVSAVNVFNTVQYNGINTTVNSANYGQVTSAASMRALTLTARYRF
jgi:hypothetical protein